MNDSNRKIKIAIIGDNRNEGYAFIRKELKEQNRALNVGMNHMYFNYVAREKIKFADDTYKRKLEEELCYLEKKIAELKEVSTEKQKAAIKKSIETTKNSIEKLRKAENKIAFEMFSGVISAAEQTNLRDVITDNFNLSSDTKDRITSIIKADFENDIKGILQGVRTIRTYKKDNPLYVRGRALELKKRK